MKIKGILLLIIIMVLTAVTGIRAQEQYSGNIVSSEGAWCWFADPRALHYENASGTIKATYLGYIDVHGNIKATQYDWLTGRKTDVLIRSNFQPDDHNNPTFVVLPDERVMIFYTRHTDEPKIWYRISRKPGDITALGEEKYLATANNTTYPSPFILSDDPTHIYLCWRGINWHPTIARLTMPDKDDNCQFDFGPKQIVQSTGARPYAKYQSNGKDKIYLSYTTGHPDNEMPNWLYFNVIDINHGNGPVLRDIKGAELKRIADGVFNVNKQDSYASLYPLTVVDNTSSIRNWVWQIALDENENPVIAYPHIDDAKTTHVYWYARWTGSEWRRTWVQYGGHAFHQNWNQTERCYSGGMTIDPDNVHDLYLSIPTSAGEYNKDGVYEIWKYTINDAGEVAVKEQITKNSAKNNVRPFIIPGSKNTPMRLAWMNGDYYYWMVNKNYPKGFPTDIRCDYAWQEEFFTLGNMTYSLDAEDYPVVTIDGVAYRSQNRLLTSDNWAFNSTGTNGDNHPTKLTTWVLTMTYDGQTLTTYRNGLVDQVIETDKLNGGTSETYVGFRLRNSLGFDRSGETVVVSIPEGIDPTSSTLTDEDGNIIPFEAIGTTAIRFQASVAAGKTKGYTLAEGTPTAPEKLTYAAIKVPSTREDIAWENDLSAYRMYSAKLLSSQPNTAQGIDVLSKKQATPIIDDMYGLSNYHNESQYGVDAYSVNGKHLGCGGVAVVENGHLLLHDPYNSCTISANDALASAFTLIYNNVKAGSATYTETLNVETRAGALLNKGTVRLDHVTVSDGNAIGAKVRLAVALYQHTDMSHNADGVAFTNVPGVIGWADNKSEGSVTSPNARFFQGAYVPSEANPRTEVIDNHLCLTFDYTIGTEQTFYFGAGWNIFPAGSYTTDDDWFLALEQFRDKVHSPLTATRRE